MRWAFRLASKGLYFQLSNVVATAFVCAFLAYSAWGMERGIDLARDAPNVTWFQMAAYVLAAVACWIAALAVTGRRKWAWTSFAAANTVAVVHVPFLFVSPASSIPIIILSVFAVVNVLGVSGLVLLLPGRLAYQKPANLLLDAGILAGSCFAMGKPNRRDDGASKQCCAARGLFPHLGFHNPRN